MAKKTMKEMAFLEHLEVLRWLLVRSSIAMVMMASVAFIFSDYLFDEIIFGPTNPNFITYTSFCDLSHYLGIADSICVTELPFIIQLFFYMRAPDPNTKDCEKMERDNDSTRFP